MWDKDHINPAFEIGSTVTDNSGNFDYNSTDFLAALPGINEIYAASYKQGFLGLDGPKEVEISSDTVLTVSAPSSVGKGKELIVSGTLLDVGGIAAANEEIEFEIWEPGWGGGKPNSIRCNPSGWQPYRCDIGTTTTDSFGNFVFNWTVPEDGQPTSDLSLIHISEPTRPY